MKKGLILAITPVKSIKKGDFYVRSNKGVNKQTGQFL
jgi:hypothetical protein